LLAWRKDRLVREDFMDCCRLAHTLERQIFDLSLYESAAKSKGPRRVVIAKKNTDKKGAKLKTDQSVVQERSVLVKDE